MFFGKIQRKLIHGTVFKALFDFNFDVDVYSICLVLKKQIKINHYLGNVIGSKLFLGKNWSMVCGLACGDRQIWINNFVCNISMVFPKIKKKQLNCNEINQKYFI